VLKLRPLENITRFLKSKEILHEEDNCSVGPICGCSDDHVLVPVDAHGFIETGNSNSEHFRGDAETDCRAQSHDNGKSTGLLQSSAQSEHFASNSFARALHRQ
jgi:hypothetical protein